MALYKEKLNTTTTNNPLISVIMPTWNAAAFLQEAIESVLNQTYQNLELILINDASTDNTIDVIQPYLKDSRLKFIDHEKLGSPAKVRNAGIKLAQGEFIAFLDADDRYYTNALESLLNQTKIGSYDVVQGTYKGMDEHSQPLNLGEQLLKDADGHLILPKELNWTPEKLVTGRLNCLLPTLLIKKSLFDAVGYFDETLPATEDYDFFIRLLTQYGNRYQRVPVMVYDYRFYANSITRDDARVYDVLGSQLTIQQKLFASPFGQQYLHLKSKATLGKYKFMARERINIGRQKLAREIIFKALNNPDITLADKLMTGSQLLLRSYLPSGFNQQLSSLVRSIRHRLKTLTQNTKGHHFAQANI